MIVFHMRWISAEHQEKAWRSEESETWKMWNYIYEKEACTLYCINRRLIKDTYVGYKEVNFIIYITAKMQQFVAWIVTILWNSWKRRKCEAFWSHFVYSNSKPINSIFMCDSKIEMHLPKHELSTMSSKVLGRKGAKTRIRAHKHLVRDP